MAAEQLAQLKQVEILVLQDPSQYPVIFPHILALSTRPDRPLRQWIANFLTNTFASRSLDGQVKEDLAGPVVDALRTLLDDGDFGVVKSFILCASLIYPLLFRRTCKNLGETALWGKLGQLKNKILGIWDQSPNEGVRIACVKFVEKVIATQTPGIKDPRLADKSDISSTIVPLNHPIIHLPALEAESQGFLDRMIALIVEQPIDPILATAVINALGPLVKTRHTLSSKIINALLSVDIAAIPQNSPDPAKAHLQLRSVSKTIRIHLSHFLRTNAAGPLSNRIDQYLRTTQVSGLMFDGEEGSRKRPAPDDLSHSNKKQKSEPQVVVDPAISSAFLLDQVNPLALFDAQSIPLPIVVEVIVRTMDVLPSNLLEDRLNLVRARLLTLPVAQPPVNETTNGDFEDYDPEDTMNFTLDSSERQPGLEEPDDAQIPVNEMAISTFELPPAEKLSPIILRQEFQASIDRILQSIRTMDKSMSYRAGISNKSISLDSIAITEWDKEAWITLLSRLSARGLCHPIPEINGHINTNPDNAEMGNTLRERLFEYIMINFRDHMDLAISWLTEEWYNDKLTSEQGGAYAKWATRIFDNIFPFIEAKDMRIFIRFLGDLPLILPSHVNKLRILCLDPERQKLGFAAIKYLLLLRPPARDACIELCIDLYKNHADTKKGAADILKRWAPGTLE